MPNRWGNAVSDVIQPKVICYPPELAGIGVASRGLLLWPCHGFRIAVPVGRRNSLNVFERTLFQLVATGRRRAGDLAALCGMPEEIVEAILSRLVQLRYLSPNLVLLRDVDEVLRGEDEAMEEALCTIFLELVGGRLLPFVMDGAPEFAKDQQWKGNGRIQFEFGTTGSSQCRTGRVISAKPALRRHLPAAHDLADLVRVHARRHRIRRPDGMGAPGAPCFEASAGSILLAPEPQDVLLAVECLIQRGNPEPLLTDPFGYGFSRQLTELHERLCRSDPKEEAWICGLYEKASIRTADARARPRTDHGDRDAPRNRITRTLRAARSAMEKALRPITSTESERKREAAIAECASLLYRATEHALDAVIERSPPDAGRRALLESGVPGSNAAILAELARKFGFEVPDEAAIALLQVAGGRLQADRLADSIEMQPLLALCLIAADGEESHPLKNLARFNPGWLVSIAKLKVRRDRADHGSLQGMGVHADELPEDWIKVREALLCLLPELPPMEEDSSLANLPSSDDQSRLKARIVAVTRLGQSGFKGMPQNLRESVLGLELALQGFDSNETIDACDRVDIGAAVRAMYTIAELALHAAQSACPTYDGEVDGARKFLAAKARDAGFPLSPSGDLPREITRVRVHLLRRAVICLPASLGAAFSALLMKMPLSELTETARRMPWLIEFVAELCALRGHYASAFMPLTELRLRVERCYTLVRWFLEI